ncbi:MAG: hypothetical protein IJZ03_01720 [Clostridia bacterium]|nr:hypothetical protein [Clostridia bacterium]
MEDNIRFTGSLGNGKILACFDRADIMSLHVGSYTSPTFLGVHADFGENFQSICSECEENNGVITHEITSYAFGDPFPRDGREIIPPRSAVDIRITDIVSKNKQMLVRYCECMRPFTVKFSIPPYVHKTFINKYRLGKHLCSVAILTLPSGVGFHKNGTSVEERRLLIIVDGEAKLASDARSVDIVSGMSRIAFVSGDPDECVENAAALLDDNYYLDRSLVFAEERNTFDCVFGRFSAKELGKINRLLPCAALTLASLQSDSGGVIGSVFNPFSEMSSLRDTVGAFLKLGAYDRARSAIDFFCRAYDKKGYFPTVISSDFITEQKYFSPSSPGCAKFISAMLDYVEATGDNEFAVKRERYMREAMYSMTKEIALSTLPFSGNEIEFYDCSLSIGSPYQGSLESTLEYASAVMRLDAFCKEHSILMPHDNGSAYRRACEFFASVEENFISEDTVRLAYPGRLDFVKPPRFAYGDCDICRLGLSSVYYGILEKDANYRYLCPRCFKESEKDVYPEVHDFGKGPQAAALLLSDPLMRKRLGKEKCAAILGRALSDVFDLSVEINTLTVARLFALVKKLDPDNIDALNAFRTMLEEDSDIISGVRRDCLLSSNIISALL